MASLFLERAVAGGHIFSFRGGDARQVIKHNFFGHRRGLVWRTLTPLVPEGGDEQAAVRVVSQPEAVNLGALGEGWHVTGTRKDTAAPPRERLASLCPVVKLVTRLKGEGVTEGEQGWKTRLQGRRRLSFIQRPCPPGPRRPPPAILGH